MGESVMNTAAAAAEEVVPTIEIAAHAGTCYGVQRALVVLRKTGETPAQYPRRFKKIQTAPL